MMRILIKCGAIAMLFIQTVSAQDNNQSISDDLKKVWGVQGSSTGTGIDMGGMYDTQTETDNTGEIEFTDNVLASSPVDGGISLLLAAGLVAGAHRIRKEVNKSKDKVNHPSK